MSCERVSPEVIVCSFVDDHGEAVVKGKTWRWDFHEYLGVTFVRADGEVAANQNPPKAVWDAFGEWLKQRRVAQQ